MNQNFMGEPKKSHAGLFAILGVVAILILGGGGYMAVKGDMFTKSPLPEESAENEELPLEEGETLSPEDFQNDRERIEDDGRPAPTVVRGGTPVPGTPRLSVSGSPRSTPTPSGALSLRVTSLSSNTELSKNEEHTITWTGSQGISKVDIFLYRKTSSGLVFDRNIILETNNDGNYIYDVPTSLSTSHNYVIRVAQTGNSGVFGDSRGHFTIEAEQELLPAVLSLNPTSGAIGTSVTITGKGMIANRDHDIIMDGANNYDVEAEAESSTKLVFKVPQNAALGIYKITVNNEDGNGTTSKNFTIILPSITSLSKSSCEIGSLCEITVSGKGFSTAGNTVKIVNGGTTFTSSNVASSNGTVLFSATIPGTAPEGTYSLSVTNANGSKTSDRSITLTHPATPPPESTPVTTPLPSTEVAP